VIPCNLALDSQMAKEFIWGKTTHALNTMDADAQQTHALVKITTNFLPQ